MLTTAVGNVRRFSRLLRKTKAWADYDAGERPLADAIKRLGRDLAA